MDSTSKGNKTDKSYYWRRRIPNYLTARQVEKLSNSEKERLLNQFKKPKEGPIELTPPARIRLFRQAILETTKIEDFEELLEDQRPVPEITEVWRVTHFILDKRREWSILGGAENYRKGTGPKFYLDLWKNLDIIDLIHSDQFSNWERAARRLQYEFRSKISRERKAYRISLYPNSSGYYSGPFDKEFRRKQALKEASRFSRNWKRDS